MPGHPKCERGVRRVHAPVLYLTIPGVPVTSDAVRAAWVPLMSKLTGAVAASPLRIANRSTPYSGPQAREMYGLAQCTRDLNASECSNCISSYTDRLGELFPNNTGGAIKGYSCYLVYQLLPLDITLPPAPPLPPSPSPPPAAPGKHLVAQLLHLLFPVDKGVQQR